MSPSGALRKLILSAHLLVRARTCVKTFRSLSSSVSSPSHAADVAIVGGGVIGCSIALNLARHGRKVVVVDANAGAGQGSTSYSSGICRPFYSLLDSVKFAYEGYSYWRDWEEHIGVEDPRGFAKLRRCGGLVLRSPLSEGFLSKCLPLFDQLGIEYEDWKREELGKRMGAASRFGMDLQSYGPPKRIDHEEFGVPNGWGIMGGVFVPETGWATCRTRNSGQPICRWPPRPRATQASFGGGASPLSTGVAVAVVRTVVLVAAKAEVAVHA